MAAERSTLNVEHCSRLRHSFRAESPNPAWWDCSYERERVDNHHSLTLVATKVGIGPPYTDAVASSSVTSTSTVIFRSCVPR